MRRQRTLDLAGPRFSRPQQLKAIYGFWQKPMLQLTVVRIFLPKEPDSLPLRQKKRELGTGKTEVKGTTQGLLLLLTYLDYLWHGCVTSTWARGGGWRPAVCPIDFTDQFGVQLASPSQSLSFTETS